ncbi:hypothetical protein F5X98DRAFT_371566 [Xylaria grammica]|nr:hypothetical protein F5X98DRAFT_371566 [Xylaria grammica]
MPPSRDVLSLYEIADKIDSRKPLKETMDAKSLFTLIKNEALAFRRPDSSKLRELADCFRRCQELASRHPDSERLKQSISQWMILFDECFFFKTLTREVKTKNGRQHVVTLKVKDGPASGGESLDMKGMWKWHRREITLWLKGDLADGGNYRFPIELLLHTLVHEAIHAFLWLFQDQDHPKHQERVGDHGHGPVFREMLRVIGGRVGELTNSHLFQQAWTLWDSTHGGKRPDPGYPPMGPPGFGGAGGFPLGGFPPRGFPPGSFPPGGFLPDDYPFH